MIKLKSIPSKIDIILFILLIVDIALTSFSSIAHFHKHDLTTTKVIENCEYIRIDNSGSWVHKGNCSNPIHVYNLTCDEPIITD